MPRLLLLGLLFVASLYACGGAFFTCKQKLRDASAFHATSLALPIGNNMRLVYSETKPDTALKYDPLLGLALIPDQKKFKYPFHFADTASKGLGAILKSQIVEGEIVSHQCGLDRLACFSKPLQGIGIVSDRCCALDAIVTPRGIIEQRYLEHFMRKDFSGYGDAGIQFAVRHKRVEITQINPYFEDLALKVGDVIVAFDGKNVSSVCALKEKILFSSPDTIHTCKVLRGNQTLHVKVKLRQKLGGGLVNESYLERSGIMLDSQLCIAKASAQTQALELKAGDCLKAVNYKTVATHNRVSALLRGDNADNLLLFEREGFEFFIHIQTKTY